MVLRGNLIWAVPENSYVTAFGQGEGFGSIMGYGYDGGKDGYGKDYYAGDNKGRGYGFGYGIHGLGLGFGNGNAGGQGEGVFTAD